jgi:hypothetical protein
MLIPVGVSPGNIQFARSSEDAVFKGALSAQAVGLGTATPKLKVIGLLLPTTFVARILMAVAAAGALTVPEIKPLRPSLATLMDKPEGSVPLDTEKAVNGGLVAAIGMDTLPTDTLVVEFAAGDVIVGTVLGRMVNVTLRDPVSATVLVAARVTVVMPLAVGVPEMAPVLVFSASPAGRVPLCTEYPVMGPLELALIVYTVAFVPTVPVAVPALPMTGALMAFTRITTFLVPVPETLAALRVTAKSPLSLGVPVI